ncbi:MAG: hypothetical protein AMJ93_06375, partial [Anaerolineae bacterium SM23_84]
GKQFPLGAVGLPDWSRLVAVSRCVDIDRGCTTMDSMGVGIVPTLFQLLRVWWQNTKWWLWAVAPQV